MNNYKIRKKLINNSIAIPKIDVWTCIFYSRSYLSIVWWVVVIVSGHKKSGSEPKRLRTAYEQAID